MQGTWRCIVRGAPNGTFKDMLAYSFSPDGHWMIEQDVLPGNTANWSLQMWGYDEQAHRLVAYQFVPRGVFTKTVTGWQNGLFVSKVDYSGYVVSIRKHNSRAFDWVITPSDNSRTIVQACTK